MATVPLDRVVPNPNQPRRSFDEIKQKELTANIKEHGLLQPILVVPTGDGMLLIVAGERRYRACRDLGHETIEVVILEPGKHDSEVLALVENVQRVGLTPIEEADAYAALIEKKGLKQKDVAKLIGKSQVYVSERLALLKLPEKTRDMVLQGQLSFSHAKLLMKSPEADKLAEHAVQTKQSVRDLKAKISAPEAKPKTPKPSKDSTNHSNIIAEGRELITKAHQHFASHGSQFAPAVEHLDAAIVALAKTEGGNPCA